MTKRQAKTGGRRLPDQPRVGVYRLRAEQVEVFGMCGRDGADTFFIPEVGRLPRMKIGLNQDWPDTVGTLVHEAMECCFNRLSAAYYRYHFGAVNDPGTFIFHASHAEFTEAASACGDFLVEVLPALKRVWRQAARERKRTEKTKRT